MDRPEHQTLFDWGCPARYHGSYCVFEAGHDGHHRSAMGDFYQITLRMDGYIDFNPKLVATAVSRVIGSKTP